MAEMIENRNQEDEMRKVYRIYDDDDNGLITAENLKNCARDINEEIDNELAKKMIEIAANSTKEKGGVDLEDFISYMKKIKLIKVPTEEENKKKIEAEEIMK
jgi:Ca2+-binding EF-hand superfamily protein